MQTLLHSEKKAKETAVVDAFWFEPLDPDETTETALEIGAQLAQTVDQPHLRRTLDVGYLQESARYAMAMPTVDRLRSFVPHCNLPRLLCWQPLGRHATSSFPCPQLCRLLYVSQPLGRQPRCRRCHRRAPPRHVRAAKRSAGSDNRNRVGGSPRPRYGTAALPPPPGLASQHVPTA